MHTKQPRPHATVMTEFGPLPSDGFLTFEELDNDERETMRKWLEYDIAHWDERWAKRRQEDEARAVWAAGVQAGKERCRAMLGLPDPEAEWLRENPWFLKPNVGYQHPRRRRRKRVRSK